MEHGPLVPMRQQRLTPTYIIQVLGEAATCATFMNAPIVKATLQAGTLAVLSNVLAQIITSYQNNVRSSILLENNSNMLNRD